MCFKCDKDVIREDDDFNYNNRGEAVCLECQHELCMTCLHGEPAVETRTGDYICEDCAQDEAEDAYDYMTGGAA